MFNWNINFLMKKIFYLTANQLILFSLESVDDNGGLWSSKEMIMHCSRNGLYHLKSVDRLIMGTDNPDML